MPKHYASEHSVFLIQDVAQKQAIPETLGGRNEHMLRKVTKAGGAVASIPPKEAQMNDTWNHETLL